MCDYQTGNLIFAHARLYRTGCVLHGAAGRRADDAKALLLTFVESKAQQRDPVCEVLRARIRRVRRQHTHGDFLYKPGLPLVPRADDELPIRQRV